MAKTPRLDRYGRLMKRLYEAIYLANELGRSQGSISRTEYNPNDQMDTRRRFLRNLAFLCDAESGGASTSAIAVESCTDCYKFQVASNSVETPDMVTFLNKILGLLKMYPSSTPDGKSTIEDTILKESTIFSEKRISNAAKRLSNAADKCAKYLETDNLKLLDERDLDLEAWLKRFVIKKKSGFNAISACQRAYEERRSMHMTTLRRLGQGPEDGSNPGNYAELFGRVKHMVGRLAHHFRVVKQLCEDCSRVSKLLESYRVARLMPPKPVPRPEADHLTTIEGIINRLIPQEQSSRAQLVDGLLNLDQQLGLEKKIQDRFSKSPSTEDKKNDPGNENEDGLNDINNNKGKKETKKERKPQVHAEMQVLDYFYIGNGQCREFAEGDRYIATSKPACFCCKLYFRYHPARCIEPDSHDNIWPLWSPIDFADITEKPAYNEQRNVLIQVTHVIRNKIFDRILQGGSFPGTHRDTATGITPSVDYHADEGYLSEDVSYGEVDSGTEREDISSYPSPPPSPQPDGGDGVAAEDEDDDAGGVSL